MAFKTKGQLNAHKKRHSNFRPYKCNFVMHLLTEKQDEKFIL